MSNGKRLLICALLCLFALVALKNVTNFQRADTRFDLVAASGMGDAGKVETLLSQSVSPNSEHLEGSSALWWAVEAGSLTTVKVLLAHGANPNGKGQYNSVLEDALTQFANAEGTPKEKAAKDIVRTLTASGADTSKIKDAESRRLLKKADARS